MDPTTLQIVWFALICVLWTGYLLLEGFDFGVGALLRVLGRERNERRALLNTFGPVWDGNEVWLLVAGGATFAAFPEWYATLFSGFYLALFVLLVAIIVRNIGIEFWGKDEDSRWKDVWEWAIVVGSILPAVLLGVAWANLAHGIPLAADGEFAGNFWTLINPYALLGGVTTLLLFCAHGTHFLGLRLHGVLRERADAAARLLAPAAAVALVLFAGWTVLLQSPVEALSAAVAAVAVLAAAGAAYVVYARRLGEGWTFGLSSLAIAALFASIWIWQFPNALRSTNAATHMTLAEASSSPYTLKVMTWVAVALVPFVLLYQGWTYWVFRRRIGAEDFAPGATPLDALGSKSHG
ncbi:MAG: cytochrome d ubiquinol oxidase subunit II [Thermoleophilia bacterium]